MRPLVVVVAVDVRSSQARRPGRQFWLLQGWLQSAICVETMASFSVSLQCAAEKTMGPFHANWISVGVPVQVAIVPGVVQVVPPYIGNSPPVLPVASGFTEASTPGHGQASTNET